MTSAGVLLQNFQTKVYCLRSIFLASEVYFLAQYQYICAIFIVVFALALSPNLLYSASVASVVIRVVQPVRRSL